jgi:phosphoribosylamine-glycine ligase
MVSQREKASSSPAIRETADAVVRSMMVERRYGDAGDRVVLEEFLVGHEASFFVLADGTDFVTIGSAQDHKRIFDDDEGPNTGGMGAFSPSPLITLRWTVACAMRSCVRSSRAWSTRGIRIEGSYTSA